MEGKLNTGLKEFPQQNSRNVNSQIKKQTNKKNPECTQGNEPSWARISKTTACVIRSIITHILK